MHGLWKRSTSRPTDGGRGHGRRWSGRRPPCWRPGRCRGRRPRGPRATPPAKRCRASSGGRPRPPRVPAAKETDSLSGEERLWSHRAGTACVRCVMCAGGRLPRIRLIRLARERAFAPSRIYHCEISPEPQGSLMHDTPGYEPGDV